MPLPASGQITLNQVNVELGLSGTAQISMGSSAVRTLFGVASGQISMSNGYGKANEFTLTISSNTQEANLSSLATAAGWNGTTKLICNINSSVYVWSASTSTAGLLISGTYANGLTVNNSGYIIGKGGGSGTGYAVTWPGKSGGPAISVTTTSSVTINNNSGAYIAGGGGGGATPTGGGGAGGGNGGSDGEYSGAYNGLGGAIGQVGQNALDPFNEGRPFGYGGGAGGGGGGVASTGRWAPGGGGGRILPGTGGAGAARYYPGGAGGAAGAAGSTGTYNITYGGGGGGGGGWGASGAQAAFGRSTIDPGGAGGAAITGNSITLNNSGTIYGST